MPNNYWGEPDDDVDMPDWMKASTYQNGGKPKKMSKSLEEAAAEAMKKPAINVTDLSWDNWKLNDDFK
jgi:hypothetical protein